MYVGLYIIPHTRRCGRAVECARLEIVYTGNGIGGSNPSISAIKIQCPGGAFNFYSVEMVVMDVRRGSQGVGETSKAQSSRHDCPAGASRGKSLIHNIFNAPAGHLIFIVWIMAAAKKSLQIGGGNINLDGVRVALMRKSENNDSRSGKSARNAGAGVRVSVLMPAYNCEKYIAAAIDGILGQTFDDFEFIILNDGGTDGTARIIAEYARRDKRIRFIDNRQNHGVAHARNMLLDAARGEYVAFADADDISRPERLARQVAFMDAHGDVSICGAWMQSFPDVDIIKTPARPGLLDFYIANPVSNPTVMMRRADVAAMRYDVAFTTGEDYDFFARASRNLRIYNMPEVLVDYRIVDGSLSHGNPKLAVADAQIRGRILDELTGDEMWRRRIGPSRHLSLFGFLPIFRVKRNMVYMLGIPVLKLRGMWWRLFYIIPLIKVTK